MGDLESHAAVLWDCGNDATGGIALGGTIRGGPFPALHLDDIDTMESNDQPATGCLAGILVSLSESSEGFVWHA